MDTMADWYGLVDGKHDFSIENDTNADLLFARHDLDKQLSSILRRAFRTQNPPKLVLYGDWGVGKTHTLRHVEYVIKNTPEYPASTVFVELPDITAKSSFQVAHAALLDALGFDIAKTWMSQYQVKFQSAAFDRIQDQTQSGDIAKAFSTLPMYGEAARTAWDWLRGLPLSAGEARSVGLAPSLEQSLHFVNVLRMFGALSREIDDKMLVLMLDEATKLQNVTQGDAINHWLNAFKVLSDQQTKEVGVIVSLSFRDPDEMPDPLQDQQVRSRFGESNYIMLVNLDEDATRDFVESLLKAWIEPSKAAALAKTYASETDGEDLGSYPFTLPALGTFVTYACQDGGVTTPRDVQKVLDDVCNLAIDENRHIISDQYMQHLMAGA